MRVCFAEQYNDSLFHVCNMLHGYLVFRTGLHTSWNPGCSRRYPITGVVMPLWLQEYGAPGTFRQSAFEGGKVVSSTHWPPLLLKENLWY
jgi:hypothetical protein